MLQTGDRAAREAFVNATYADLFRWFCWLSNNRDSAADLTQATFTSFWGSLFTGDPNVDARIWLFGVGRNHWRNTCRTKRRRGAAASEELNESKLGATPASENPDQAAAAAECAQEVRRAVATLSADVREALTLRYWQDCSYDEIALVLQITPEAARQRVFQGRKRLARLLRPWAPEGVKL